MDSLKRFGGSCCLNLQVRTSEPEDRGSRSQKFFKPPTRFYDATDENIRAQSFTKISNIHVNTQTAMLCIMNIYLSTEQCALVNMELVRHNCGTFVLLFFRRIVLSSQ